MQAPECLSPDGVEMPVVVRVVAATDLSAVPRPAAERAALISRENCCVGASSVGCCQMAASASNGGPLSSDQRQRGFCYGSNMTARFRRERWPGAVDFHGRCYQAREG